MTEVQLRMFARAAKRACWRHMGLSLGVGAIALACYAVLGGTPSTCPFVVALTTVLVAYNVVRIRSAQRAATGSIDAGRAFVLGQRRSHLVRGPIFLVSAPVLVATCGGGKRIHAATLQ